VRPFSRNRSKVVLVGRNKPRQKSFEGRENVARSQAGVFDALSPSEIFKPPFMTVAIRDAEFIDGRAAKPLGAPVAAA
jgi:hypothetical protein